jgi:hypothetical protein
MPVPSEPFAAVYEAAPSVVLIKTDKSIGSGTKCELITDGKELMIYSTVQR